MTTILPTVTSTTNASATSAAASAADNTEIASNFTTFLQLLTTQLQNQDPLSPMDTNQSPSNWWNSPASSSR
ncbi:MAG: flagellar hook capping FlgD N-terminal domain-containing protein [Pseudolabrys sp.]